MSFDLAQNEQRFLFPFPELAGIGDGTCCGKGPITDAIATWTDNGIPVLGGFALILIAGFTSSVLSVQYLKISFGKAHKHSKHKH